MNQISIKNRKINLPIFLPDATRGVVRSIDSNDLEKAHVKGVVVNTYHLMIQPGVSVLKTIGGIKSLMNWSGLVVSDSGGFQVMSLIHQKKAFGHLVEDGIVFYSGLKSRKKKYLFTPEKSIQVQFALKPDIMICLDDCPSFNAKQKDVEESVVRTIKWAKRCKKEYLKQIKEQKIKDSQRPLLFAVIQGGSSKELRKKCAQELIKIGFDGFGFGGWPIDKSGNLNLEILKFTAELIPDNLPKFALGVGNPQAIIECFKSGYQIFDCVLPTRDARHERLYIFKNNPDKIDILNKKDNFEYIYISREKYVCDANPISRFCDCHTCQNYSRAYLHHLFKIGDSLAWRLATIHNLRTYTKLIEILKKRSCQ